MKHLTQVEAILTKHAGCMNATSLDELRKVIRDDPNLTMDIARAFLEQATELRLAHVRILYPIAVVPGTREDPAHISISYVGSLPQPNQVGITFNQDVT